MMTFLVAALSGLVLAASGPEAGTLAPEFSLPDQAGRMRTLDSLMGPQGLVLVFFRSADW